MPVVHPPVGRCFAPSSSFSLFQIANYACNCLIFHRILKSLLDVTTAPIPFQLIQFIVRSLHETRLDVVKSVTVASCGRFLAAGCNQRFPQVFDPVTDPYFFDVSAEPWVLAVESQWEVIRDELKVN